MGVRTIQFGSPDWTMLITKRTYYNIPINKPEVILVLIKNL